MKTMKEILKKCQECQAQVMEMNDGHSFYIDAMSIEYSEKGNHRIFVTASLTLKCKVEGHWSFYPEDSDEEIAAKAEEMEEYIKNLKK